MRKCRTAVVALLASSLAGCAATIPHAPSDVSSAEIERYRFGMYQECQAAGDLRGEAVLAARAFCDCVYDTLSRNVSADAWRKLVFLNLNGRAQEERAALAPVLGGVSLCRTTMAPASATPHFEPTAALEGIWAWKRPFDDCHESFEFRGDGTARFERGDERTENTYRVAAAPEAGGRYRVNIAPTWFAFGVTCDGSFRDEGERRAPVYVLFGARLETLAVCDSADGADCVGPLRRERK